MKLLIEAIPYIKDILGRLSGNSRIFVNIFGLVWGWCDEVVDVELIRWRDIPVNRGMNENPKGRHSP